MAKEFELNNFHKDIMGYILSTKDERTSSTLLRFEELCDKAKQIIWDFICFSKKPYMYIETLDDFYGLTPIEQIFNSVLHLYKYVTNSTFYFEICPQVEITIADKTYIADFCCDAFVFNGIEWQLDKKIVIECDGYESHHTKEQRNRDTYRENELKLNGYSVIRFTGSQIYNHPYECFEKALCFITEENKNCIKQAFDEVYKNGKI